MTTKVYTWIDQDLCTGDGLCGEIVPEIYVGHSDGLWYVKEVDWPDIYNGEGGEPKLQMAKGLAFVPDRLMDAAVEAAEECPGECIFFKVIDDE